MKKEASFSYDVRGDLEERFKENIHVYLIPNMMRTGKKPYDTYFCYDGKFFAIELKSQTGKSLNFKNDIKPHQPQCLKDVQSAGGRACFLVQFKVRCERGGTAYIIDPKFVTDMLKEGIESISQDDLEAHAGPENRIWRIEKFDGKWDATKIIQMMEMCRA